MPVETEKKERVRALLKKANIEIGAALTRVDSMGPYELAEVAGAAEATRAFFDKNNVCATPEVGGIASLESARAFFDKNNVCGAPDIGSDAEKGLALINALRGAIR
ncbi:hypothetical protein [Sinorhizobium alkalisoli]|uniref:hypothetical protein n=1 Tax=Sinorhizobium alkalisoli TaxID=1752398 RepID=UPI00124D8163|nr:hypothetical protein [Sinorhizobium alkalisoli]MCA1493412.1 hypothetical protein [Ensifer sp. NBAIM29]MCG5479719.1 hypothetical protein [Sinorhizobium alkalisoli]QFI68700.1 hypothetical protein EKH55_3826 [Sinorhizobium alkalisoli]